MSYTKYREDWVDDDESKPADGDAFDHIEEGIQDAHDAIDAHLADTADAHDASAISVLDTAANFTGTDVEAVLAELQDNIDGLTVTGVSYVLVRDEKTQNTAGGTFTSGAWQTRTLNTEVSDPDGICSLSSNQVTLSAGTYECFISCPAFGVERHQARLQNVTDATTVIVGTSAYCTSNGTATGQSASIVVGRFTIGASKALEVQHRCQSTLATTGFGTEGNFGTEVYTVAEFRKVA